MVLEWQEHSCTYANTKAVKYCEVDISISRLVRTFRFHMPKPYLPTSAFIFWMQILYLLLLQYLFLLQHLSAMPQSLLPAEFQALPRLLPQAFLLPPFSQQVSFSFCN